MKTIKRRCRKYLKTKVNLQVFSIIIFIIGCLFLNCTIEDVSKSKNSGNSSAAQTDELKKQITSIGYLSGYQDAPDKKNVTTYDAKKACNGLNIFTSGHGPEAILMDMKGKEIHKWKYELQKAWPGFVKHEEIGEDDMHHFRRVHLFDNGDILAIFEGTGMLKLDSNSNLIWKYGNKVHHDVSVTDVGDLYTLTRKINKVPTLEGKHPILEDFITVLDSNGVEQKSVSILECLLNSKYSPILHTYMKGTDPFHTNTIEVLDGSLSHKNEAFKKGNVLVSLLRMDTIGVVDLEKKKFVWALSGMWSKQHQPSILKNQRILLFDNVGLAKVSRVIEFDPFTQKVYWEYGGVPSQPLYTYNNGSTARLSNGNTMISESNAGRALEVSADKKIVWEFYNPYRSGDKGEKIATLFEMQRLPADFKTDWLKN